MIPNLSNYSPEQALAHNLLIHALNGASLHWAHVHGYTVDCTADEVRAEGIDVNDRSVWSVDIDDISRAITKLIEQPLACGDPDFIRDTGMLTFVSATLATARSRDFARLTDLPAGPKATPDTREDFEDLIADVVLQVAVTGEVIH